LTHHALVEEFEERWQAGGTLAKSFFYFGYFSFTFSPSNEAL
jgi:hypothetical protein